MRELRGNNKPFGGVLFIIAGDIGQTLPKISGVRSKTVLLNSLFCRSKLFKYFKVYELTKNLRLSLHKTEQTKKVFKDYERFCYKLEMGLIHMMNMTN